LLRKVLNERVIVTENSGRRKISKLEVIVTQLVNRAAKGDPKATQILLGLQRDIEGPTEPADPETSVISETDQQIIHRIQARFWGERG
jgi:hypothetical protein